MPVVWKERKEESDGFIYNIDIVLLHHPPKGRCLRHSAPNLVLSVLQYRSKPDVHESVVSLPVLLGAKTPRQ